MISKANFWLIGYVCGLIFATCLFQFGNETMHTGKQAEKTIEECQKDLPRSQVCELTAKVKEGKE